MELGKLYIFDDDVVRLEHYYALCRKGKGSIHYVCIVVDESGSPSKGERFACMSNELEPYHENHN